MSDLIDSFLNQKRMNLVSKLYGDETKDTLKESFKEAFEKALIDIDNKTIELLNFITRLDNIGNIDEGLKDLYNIGNRKVHVVNTQKDLNIAIENLFKSKVLGFDTEQKPVFEKGVPANNISIVQLSDAQNAYVFQVQQIGNLTPLLDLLASSKVIKVGIGLRGDISSIFNEFNITLKACIDFGLLFKSKLYYENELGAKKSVLFFLDKKLQKSGRASRSNWEIKKLSPSQVKYASEDSSCVYDVFCAMLIEYPYLVEILPSWFKDKYNNNEYELILKEFKETL